MALVADPNTLSNHLALATEHTAVDVALDFKASVLSGTAVLEMKVVEEEVKEVVLDSSYLDIQKVEVNGTPAEWKVTDRKEPYGSAVTVALVGKPTKGETLKVKITYSTTDKCTALQWMAPEQTSNKKAPYMFSQCQAIHARSLYPCQDTPAVKSTFAMSIRSPHNVVATGLPTGAKDFKDGTLAYTFQQDIPIPSYLFALASGDIASASIGPRSTIYTGPEELLKCKLELEDDMEKFLQIAEGIVYPYPWTVFNVLILPPSFPYGGMENPNITFATPTIISGDKSNIDVIAHELAHSWSGNLVTATNWEHFWLNEGWTIYLERRIIGALHGEPHFHFSAIIGWKALQESVSLFGPTHRFTQLIVPLAGEDPDDAFSSIPYEKGFNFLYSLDNLVGREKWNAFIPHYFKTYHQKSLTSFDFKRTLLEFFAPDPEATEKLNGVDWHTAFYSPGLPPKPDFDTTLADVCYALASCWQSLPTTAFTPSPADIAGWSSGQLVVFLETVSDFPTPLAAADVNLMAETYKFLESENAEILSRFLTVGLKSRDEKMYAKTAEKLGVWGRMKFVRPLYRLLNGCDRELAVDTFRRHEGFYHPICRDAVKKDLKL